MVMFGELFNLLQTSPITFLQQNEIKINKLAQETLRCAEPKWVLFSEYLSASQLMDVIVPFVGVFHHKLLVRLVCSLAIINTVNSLIKWSSPEYRPQWWIREYTKFTNDSLYLKRPHLACETTAGFPSSHSMSFTAFAYLVVVFYFNNYKVKLPHLAKNYICSICYVITITTSFIMWLSRLFLATSFLHQCVIGSTSALVLLQIFEKNSTFLYSLRRQIAVPLVVGLILLPISVYFAMLSMDIDPHWSVRMAFKWCSNTDLLRHETSPVFVLSRDLGYLMGVALSAPIYKRYENRKSSLFRRILLCSIFELLNYYARLETPKQHGRSAFIAYEFTRNLLHSYTLLTIYTKLT